MSIVVELTHQCHLRFGQELVAARLGYMALRRCEDDGTLPISHLGTI